MTSNPKADPAAVRRVLAGDAKYSDVNPIVVAEVQRILDAEARRRAAVQQA